MSNSSGKLNLPHGTGRAGEAAARSFVSIELGLDIAQCNFRTREGEIDIIAKSGVEYIFFEVKTRALRLQTTGQRYLEQIGAENADWRIDLLSVEMDKTGRVQKVTHVENAIEEQS